jgi:hypothetical protein
VVHIVKTARASGSHSYKFVNGSLCTCVSYLLILINRYANTRWRTPKEQSRIDNPETLETKQQEQVVHIVKTARASGSHS